MSDPRAVRLLATDGTPATVTVTPDESGAVLDIWWNGGGFNVELHATADEAAELGRTLLERP